MTMQVRVLIKNFREFLTVQGTSCSTTLILTPIVDSTFTVNKKIIQAKIFLFSAIFKVFWIEVTQRCVQDSPEVTWVPRDFSLKSWL